MADDLRSLLGGSSNSGVGANPVIQGLEMFRQSVQGIAQQRAISSAREQVDQIRQADADEEEKLQLTKQLGQQFALDAMGAGMDAGKVESFMKQIAPAERLYQTPEQAVLNAPAGSAARQRGETLLADQRDQRNLEIESRGANAQASAQIKVEGARKKAAETSLDKGIGEFMRAADVKPLLESRQELTNILAIDDAELSKEAVGFNLMKKGLAKLAEGGGKITDKDYEIIQGSPDVVSKVKRFVATNATGKPLKADVDTVRKAAQVLGAATERRLRESANAFALSKDGLYGVPATDIQTRLNARLGGGAAPAAAPAKKAGGGLRGYLE